MNPGDHINISGDEYVIRSSDPNGILLYPVGGLSMQDLTGVYQTNPYTSESRNNDELWKNKIILEFGQEALQHKPINDTWKQYYSDIINILGTSGGGASRRAAASGYLFLLQILKDRGYKFSEDIVDTAADFNHPEVLKWLIENEIGDTRYIVDIAASNKFYDLLEWLEQENIFPSERGLNWAARNGDLYLLKHYAQFGLLPNILGEKMALKNNHTDVVQWLASQNL